MATLSAEIKRTVEKATVTFSRTGGKGVLVRNHLIITAAHCIEFELEGRMVLDENYSIEEIRTSEGQTLKARPLAVEPVADIAVIGSLDGQVFYDEAEDFFSFCSSVEPVSVSRTDFALTQDPDLVRNRIHIYTHKGEWITGNAIQFLPAPQMVGFDTVEQIEGGTSGSPIVKDSGELVGIISNASLILESGQVCCGTFPRPHLTLPVWVCRGIFEEQEGKKEVI
jgi:hypothetical protein